MQSVENAVQSPEEQVQAYFVAQAATIIQGFKERVVYYGLDYNVEEPALDQELKDWDEKFNSLSQVQLGGCKPPGAPWDITVQLTPELKKRVFVEVYELHKAMKHVCKDPELVMNYLDKGLVPEPKKKQ